MPSKQRVIIEYFDRDTSSFKERLTIELDPTQRPNVFLDNSNVLNVREADGSRPWHYIPLANVKEWRIVDVEG